MRMREEKGHDEVVEEVVKRLTKNDLYVKYKWKVRKLVFLGVVIGLEEIKIEKENMKEELDWLTPKGVKDIQKFLVTISCQDC